MTRCAFPITITTALLLVSGLLDPPAAYGMSAAATAIHLETHRGDERARLNTPDVAARPNVETHEGPGGWTTVSRRDGRGRTSVVEHQRSGVAPLESITAVTSRALRDVYDVAGRFRTADDPNAPHRLAGIDIRRADALPGAAPLVHLAYTRDFAAAGQAAPWLTVRPSDNGAAEVVSRYFVDAQLRLTRSEEDAVTRSYTWHADGRRDLETVSAPGVEHSIRHHYDPFGQLDGLSRWTGADEPALPTMDVISDGQHRLPARKWHGPHGRRRPPGPRPSRQPHRQPDRGRRRERGNLRIFSAHRN